ncbi:MAG TPA: GNAT family protein [Clostridia bacterium]|nr:GNAT family protein [Clostridia bacterium]
MLDGKLVRLREYRKEDISLKLSYGNDPEVLRYMESGIPYPTTLNEELRWFDSISAFKDSYRFAIETIEGSHYIGDCGFNSIDWKNSVANVVILIGNKEYWGRGYGTEAMQILLFFAFNQINVNKVRLNVYSFNERAIKSYEKCGFKREGVLRNEIFRDGKYYDTIALGIMRDEYIGK